MKSRMVLLVSSFVAFLLVILVSPGAGNTWPSAAEDQVEASINLAQPPRLVMPFLVALRQGDERAAISAYFEKIGIGTCVGDLLDAWLKRTLKKGLTTQEEIVTLFGPHFKNLDRPERDGLVSIEYWLNQDKDCFFGFGYAFHFDAKTNRLLSWAPVAGGICGFCPHVFADDGQWRLEGKMLAGRIGVPHEGSDTLLLPRLKERNGRLLVKLVNLAPEIEYIDQIQLAAVDLKPGEELDVGFDDRPVIWTPGVQINAPMRRTSGGLDEYIQRLDQSRAGQVLVIEAFNTSKFQDAMRAYVLGHVDHAPAAALRVEFDTGEVREVKPVGTKFLRRIVIPVEPEARLVRLSAGEGFWFVHRLWVGVGKTVENTIRWESPVSAKGPTPEALTALMRADRERLRLDPSQEVELTFKPKELSDNGNRLGFLVRVTGYYEFLPDAQRK